MSDRKQQLCIEALERSRSKLRIALKVFIEQAHTKSLDGIDICEHENGVCWCDYHDALRNAQEALANDDLSNGHHWSFPGISLANGYRADEKN
jgi:hypothetical protein